MSPFHVIYAANESTLNQTLYGDALLMFVSSNMQFEGKQYIEGFAVKWKSKSLLKNTVYSPSWDIYTHSIQESINECDAVHYNNSAASRGLGLEFVVTLFETHWPWKHPRMFSDVEHLFGSVTTSYPKGLICSAHPHQLIHCRHRKLQRHRLLMLH